jgi:hypothetical protein
MALKNVEEAMVDRIRRAVSKELKALRRRASTTRNGHTGGAALRGEAEAMTAEAISRRYQASRRRCNRDTGSAAQTICPLVEGGRAMS